MSLRNLSLPSNLPSNLRVEIADITDQLPVNPHYTWAALAGVRSLEQLTTIAVHHDAWPKKNRSYASDIDFAIEIAQDHIDSTMNEANGDAGFPYQLWIRNGRIYQTNDLLDRVYGVGSNNGYTVHICVSGEYYTTDTLTDADRNALYAAILAVKAVLPSFQEIKAHKEFKGNKTDCPGFDINRVRSDIQSIENRIQYEQSEGNTKAVAFSIANQILYLYNMAQGKLPDGSAASEGEAAWGMNMLMELKPFMDERQLL